ncbi:hypothetical protein THIOM_001527, partial [Candidatus Thiomargarita nelsonii]
MILNGADDGAKYAPYIFLGRDDVKLPSCSLACATYFLTINVRDRKRIDLTCHEFRQALLQGIKRIRQTLPFKMDGGVLLPNHWHCILTLPPTGHYPKMKTAKKTIERGTDEAFLQLMTVSGSSILKLLGVPPKKAERYQFRSVNLKEKLFEPDLEGIPLLLSFDSPVFIEFQGYSDKFIRYRLAIEVFQGCLQQKYEGKAIAGIIYTDPEYQTAALPLKALTAKNDQRL